MQLICWARQLRTQQTRAEALLWMHLRGGRLDGLRFRRQQPIGRYIADFYCHEALLVVEVDGEHHAEEPHRAHDETRDSLLGKLGIRVLRFPKAAVLQRPGWVLARIHETARSAGSKPPA